MNTPDVVESRPNLPWFRLAQTLIALGGFAGFAAFSAGGPPWWLPGFSVLAILVLMPPCIEIVLYWPRKVVADRQYLSWSSWRGETHVPWNQVRAYYEDRLRGVAVDKVETEAGPLVLRREWRQAEVLKQAIQERATEATTHQWLSKAAYQTANVSHTYQYSSTLTIGYEEVLFVVIIIMTLYASVRLLIQSSKPGWEFKLVGGFFLLYGLLASGFLVLHFWRTFTTARHRHLERIVVSPGGISWTDGQRNVQSTWTELLTLRREHPPGFLNPSYWTVETRAGDFTFVEIALLDGSILLDTIKNHLPPERQITN